VNPRLCRLTWSAVGLLLLGACSPALHGEEEQACELPDVPLLVTPGEYEVAPGTTQTLQLFSSARPGAFERLPPPCRAYWSLSDGAPASIGAATGTLIVAGDAPDGLGFTVIARLAGRDVTTSVRVVDPGESPLVGTWRQRGEVACMGSEERVVPEPIRELRFRRDGGFSVTWNPFESYTDYSGTFAYDAARGTLRLTVTQSNSLPPELDLEGRAELGGDGVLRLRGLWLGSRTPGEERGCGMIFERQTG
jgi:hypothetical protein